LKDRGGGILNRDFITGVIISSLVFLVAGTISILGSIGAMLAPLPILYYYSKLGRARGILVFLLSLIVVVIALKYVNSYVTFLNLFLLGSLGIILSEVLRRNYSIETTVFFSVVALLSLGLVMLLYLSIMQGKGPLYLIQSYIANVVQENIRIYSQLGGSSEQIELLKKHAEHITRFFTHLFPAIVLVGTAFFVWLNILAGRILFQKNGMWYPDFGDLSRWKMHDKFIWLLIVSGILVLVPFGTLKIVGLNVLVLLLLFYLFQGLSIVQFYCNKKSIPLFIRVIGYFLIFAQQFLLLLVIGLGVIDVWADFRKLGKTS
jgi:uncharacterized protein YybS (DUF2232 family)